MNTLSNIRFAGSEYEPSVQVLSLFCLAPDDTKFILECTKTVRGLVTRISPSAVKDSRSKGRDYIHVPSGLVYNWVTHVVNHVSRGISNTKVQYDFENKTVTVDFGQLPPVVDAIDADTQHTSLFKE